MYPQQKIEDAVLALLGAFQFDEGRTWKRYDFSVMEALHAQGGTCSDLPQGQGGVRAPDA